MVPTSSVNGNTTTTTATTATTTGAEDDNDDDQKHQHQEQDQPEVDDEVDEEPSLSQLLAALAVGARAVQGLPFDDDFEYHASFPEFASQLGSTKVALLDVLSMALSNKNGSKDGMIDAIPPPDDDFLLLDAEVDDPYLWEKCAEACDVLLDDVESYLEQASRQKKNKAATISATMSATDTTSQWKKWSVRARQRAQSTLGRLADELVDIVKPQIQYQITVQNDRLTPFIPQVHPDKPFGVTPLDLSLQPGHGLETCTASVKSINTASNSIPTRYPDNIIAPLHHVPHVYQTEIESFTYRPWQLQAHEPTSGATIRVVDPLEATWIDNESALEQLAAKLAKVSHVAIDLEAHSHRSFAGLTCLMQLSIRSKEVTTTPTTADSDTTTPPSEIENYLLDPFALGVKIMNKHLAAMFANPDIVKIMHGADWDIGWLQRDFGIYVVNLFDTGRAARAMKFASAGYAYLLHHYVGIMAEKHHQLSDWRQRPLPATMQQYAIRDTYYLLDIYERLKWDLEQASIRGAVDASIVHVLDVSRKICLIRYDKEPFQPDGYKWLLGGRGRSGGDSSSHHRRTQNRLTPAQERVLATLWDWRDETARECDESLMYVCPNPALLRLSLASPTTVAALQSALNPIPPLLLQYASNVVDRIKRALVMTKDDEVGGDGTQSGAEHSGDNVANPRPHPPPAPSATSTTLLDDDDDEVANSNSRSRSRQAPTPSSAFFKPAEIPPDRSDHQARNLLSPVLGTDALYQQAGWMTPQNHTQHGGGGGGDPDDDNVERELELAASTTTSDDDECDPSGKPKHLLVLDKANQNFKAGKYMTHSMKMKVVAEGEQDPAVVVSTDTAGGPNRRGRSVDGLGPTRAAREHSKSPTPMTAEEKARQAQQAAARVRISLSRKEDDLTMISPSTELNDDEDDDEGEELVGTREQERGDKENGATEQEAEEEFVIPKSLKEIYKISNQNRRNKKSSPTPERSGGAAQENEKELNALARAEALLQARGLNERGYFDTGDYALGNKRQRTKSTEIESEESPGGSDGATGSGNVSRDDDIAFMQEMGWIHSKEEVEKLLAQRQGERAESSAPESTVGPADEENVEDEETRRVSSSNSGSNNNNNRSRDGNSRQPHHQQPSPAFDYSTVGNIGAFQSQAPSNPFFAGAALAGGALAQGFARGGPERKRSGGRGGGGNKQQQQGRTRERPEKKESRTHVYKKK